MKQAPNAVTMGVAAAVATQVLLLILLALVPPQQKVPQPDIEKTCTWSDAPIEQFNQFEPVAVTIPGRGSQGPNPPLKTARQPLPEKLRMPGFRDKTDCQRALDRGQDLTWAGM